MKLFQKLLLGPVAVGLLSPLAASASEANLDDVTSYAVSNSDITRDSFKPLSSKNPLLAGGEGLNNSQSDSDFDGDTFSSTTSASFESNWAAGAVDGLANEEKVGVIFDYKIALTTSFTGNDSLDVELEAGRGDDRLTDLDFAGSGVTKANSAQTVKLDSISYTTSLGDKATFFLGHGTPGSALYSSACKYSGVGTKTLSDCGQASSALDVDDVNSAFGAMGNEYFRFFDQRIAEAVTFDYRNIHNLDAKILRIFNTYGPRMHPEDGRVISNFIVQALKNQTITLYGDGSQTRSFCYVDDLINGVILLMDSNYTNPINIGNPKEFSIKELAILIRNLVNPDLEFEYKELPEDDPKQRQPSIQLAKDLLNWEPKIQLNEGLVKTIDWFKNNL